jgi:hypothetical protein
MVPRLSEITDALRGAIQLAQLDATGLRYFDRTAGGFWRSFFAAILIAPVRAVLIVLSGEVPSGIGLARAIAVETIAYAVSWLIYPFAMLLAVDLLKRRERFFDYMVPYNWANVPAAGLFLIVAATGFVLPDRVYLFVSLMAFVSVLIYQWFIARVGLVVSATAAVALVLLDLVLYFAIAHITERLLTV